MQLGIVAIERPALLFNQRLDSSLELFFGVGNPARIPEMTIQFDMRNIEPFRKLAGQALFSRTRQVPAITILR